MAAVFFTTGVCYATVNRQTQSNAKSLSLYEKALKDHGFVYGINYYSVPGGLGRSAKQQRQLFPSKECACAQHRGHRQQ